MSALRAPTRITLALDQAHRRACEASVEDETAALLGGTTHPLAGEYRVARAFFDTLTHFGPGRQRYFAYADERNHVLVAPPLLTLTWYPRDFPGFGPVVLPSSDEWPLYLRAAAEAGFPPACGPNGHLGSWDVRVEDPQREAALAVVLRAHRIEWRPVDHAANLRCYRLDRFANLRTALSEAFSDWILPPRETMPPPPGAAGPEVSPRSIEPQGPSEPNLFGQSVGPAGGSGETPNPETPPQTSLF